MRRESTNLQIYSLHAPRAVGEHRGRGRRAVSLSATDGECQQHAESAPGQTPRAERARLVERLRLACELAAGRGCLLLVETHPNTLADTLDSTTRLLAEVDHPALAINLDVLHLWEAGDDPAHAFRQLQPHVAHFHLKNISSRRWLSVFAPSNVYAAAGCRRGMVPLFDGAFDYETFLLSLTANDSIEASLEWFGHHVHEVLDGDAMKIAQISRQMPKRRPECPASCR